MNLVRIGWLVWGNVVSKLLGATGAGYQRANVVCMGLTLLTTAVGNPTSQITVVLGPVGAYSF